MEWVLTSNGQVPSGRRPVEGGYERDGKVGIRLQSINSTDRRVQHLFHAAAIINGVRVPGKTGSHLVCHVLSVISILAE